MIDQTLGTEFIRNNPEDPTVLLQKFENGKIALLFSASWCPPCQKFLPKCIEFYNTINKDSKKMEIIYVSGRQLHIRIHILRAISIKFDLLTSIQHTHLFIK